MRRAGPSPVDRIVDVDVNAGWREGKVYYAHIGRGSPQGERQATKCATCDAVESEAEQPLSRAYTFEISIDVCSFHEGFRGSSGSHLKLKFYYVFFPELYSPGADGKSPGCNATIWRLESVSNGWPGRHKQFVHHSRPVGEPKYSLESEAHSVDYGFGIL